MKDHWSCELEVTRSGGRRLPQADAKMRSWQRHSAAPRGCAAGRNLLQTLPLITATLLSSFAFAQSRDNSADTAFRDDFVDLEKWQNWEFEKVDAATRYEIVEKEEGNVLKVEANGSASGLILKENFTTEERVRLRWRWRADVLPETGDPLRRQGDDYAIRVYVIFEQDASEAGWLERWALRNAPFRDEDFLPERSIAYAWSDREDLPDHYPNPYTDRVAVFPLQMPNKSNKTWQEIEVAPVADYRRAFEREPPRYFRLALMGDADDSESTALAWLDYIEVRVD